MKSHRAMAHWHGPIGAATIAIIVGTLAISNMAMASGPVPAKKAANTPLQKGKAALQGKGITLMVDSNAGSAYDVEFRGIAAAMGTYLNASVTVLDNSSGTGITAQDILDHSSPNGLTIGLYSLGQYYFDQVTNQTSLNFNPAKVPIIGVPEGYPLQVLYTLPNSPYQTIPELQDSTTPVRFCMYNTLVNTDTSLFIRAFGIRNFSYVTGYQTGTAEFNGFLQNQCNLIVAAPGTGQSEIRAHTVIPLAVLQGGTSLKSYAPRGLTLLADVPTTAQLLTKYKPTTPVEKKGAALLQTILNVPNNSLGAPPRTPTDIMDALTAAMQYAMKQPTVIRLFITDDLPGVFQSGATTRSRFLAGLNDVKAVKSLIGTGV